MKQKMILPVMLIAVAAALLSYKKTQTPGNMPAGIAGNRQVQFKTVKVDGLDIFYREAGDNNKPTLLLLHGFPSSSHMYRNLIDDLSASYHLIAPDFPGFGQSSAPAPNVYDYTFDNLAATTTHFMEAVGLKKCSIYMQDYGGPVGFRIASQQPGAIQAIIVQNANAYTEGLGTEVKTLVDYFENPNEATEKNVRDLLVFSTTKWQYTDGAENKTAISPDSYTTDQYYLDRPGNDIIQLSLFRNYKSNLALYDTWHAYFRKYHPATLVISGKNDKIFIAAGAEAFKKDNPDAQISLLNGGHFVLEEKHAEAAALIKSFLERKGIK